jgi:hypothetical protein
MFLVKVRLEGRRAAAAPDGLFRASVASTILPSIASGLHSAEAASWDDPLTASMMKLTVARLKQVPTLG